MISFMIDKSEALKLNIPRTDKSIFYTWKGKVFFSANARGDTLECHIAAKGKNKLFLRQAINQFCQYMFMTFAWCKKITANVKMKSVKNLCEKCGFIKLADIDNCEVMALWAA